MKKLILSLMIFINFPLYAQNLNNLENLEQRVRGFFVTANAPSKYTYGGYIIYHQEMDNNLCVIKKSAFPNALFMVDHEGGSVNRLKSKLPAANRVDDIDKYLNLWERDAKVFKSKCFDMILGPTVDAYFGSRSYSDNVPQNILMADKISSVLEHNRLIPTYKHFPGAFNNCVAPNVRKELLVCPQGIKEIKDNWGNFKNAPALMISNYVYKGYSNSPAVMEKKYYDYLRGDLNYQGVIITDALWEMSVPLTNENIWEIFKNADLIMIMNPQDAERVIPYVVSQLEKNPQLIKDLDKKEQRIKKMKEILKL